VSVVRQRRGFAVATALFALMVIGAVAVGSLFAATRELRAGSESIHQTRAIMAAELGVEQTLSSWSTGWNGAFGRGYGRTWMFTTPEGADVAVTLTRLADDVFLVTSEAGAGPARRQVARVVRLDVADPPLFAALAARIPLDPGTGVDGTDHSPLQWDCPEASGGIAQFVVADTNSLLRFGQFDWLTLTELATTRVGPLAIGAAPRFTDEECDTSDQLNWGEPMRSNGGACTGYFPVIHAAGDLVIAGGRGQGVLVVDGDLTLGGGFEFYGAVLVRGALLAGPGGARLTGVVSLALEGSIPPALDGLTIDFSRCVARKALLGLATPVPLVERSWNEGFSDK